jgi:hypothetical protein
MSDKTLEDLVVEVQLGLHQAAGISTQVYSETTIVSLSSLMRFIRSLLILKRIGSDLRRTENTRWMAPLVEQRFPLVIRSRIT